jgi:hypothetical protein
LSKPWRWYSAPSLVLDWLTFASRGNEESLSGWPSCVECGLLGLPRGLGLFSRWMTR